MPSNSPVNTDALRIPPLHGFQPQVAGYVYVKPHVKILRMIFSLGALATGVAFSLYGFLAVLLSDRDRGAMSEVFGTAYGAAYVLPTAALGLAVTLLLIVLLARHSASLAKLVGLSSVWVFSILVVLAGLMAASWQFVALGSAVGIAGTVVVVAVVRSVRGSAD